MAAAALGAVFAMVFGVFLVWRGGEWVLNRVIYENRAFAIENIDVQTDGVIAVRELRRWAGVRLGQNLLALDLARVQRDLKLVSLIESVSVERVLPHTLRIRVNEREPLAQLSLPRPRAAGGMETTPFYVDEEGYVILPLDPSQQSALPHPSGETLPVIKGLTGNEVQVGHRVESPQVQAALQLLVAFDRSPMAGLADLKAIDVSAPEALIATTEQGGEVTFGLNGFDQQLRRWHEIFELGRKVGKAILSLDLAVTNHIPARWLEASAAPLAPPRPHKPLKKRHV
jgi:cell division septal protein FtsQ